MKYVPFYFLLLLVFASCEEDVLNPNILPDNALTFIDQNYPNAVIETIEYEDDIEDDLDDDDVDYDDYCYDVELADGTDLYFDCNGEFLWSDDDDESDNIDYDELPQSVQDYLAQNYPNAEICEIDEEDDADEPYRYEVTLTNGLELYFDANGNFLFAEQDDDNECDDVDGYQDDDSDSNYDELPESIQDYLTQNHANDPICEIDEEDDADEPYTWEITLESGLELYFDADGNFLFSEQDEDYVCGEDDADSDDPDSDFADLPQAIQDYLNQNHPNTPICEVYEENDPDEDYTFEVTLQNGQELYFDAAGNFLYAEQTNDVDCD
ncbi:MAG: PepSY-like domain-containing protein [Bacteroidota bacterium]